MKDWKNVLSITPPAMVAATLLGAFLYGVFLIRDMNLTAVALYQESEAGIKRDAIARSMQVLENSEKERLALLDERTISRAEIVSFIEKIERTAREIGVDIEITSVSTDKTEKADTQEKVAIYLDTEGNWESSMRFIQALERLPHAVTLEGVTLSKVAEQSDIWQAKIPLLIDIYE